MNSNLQTALNIIKRYNNPSVSLLQVEMKISQSEAESIIAQLRSDGLLPTTSNLPLSSSSTMTAKSSFSTKFDIDSIEGHSFEYYCADLLRYNGFSNIQVTSGSGDFGVDILCQKSSLSYAIQCKKYSGNVGNHAVQEVVSGKIFYKCNKAIVMTNSYFTKAAYETARMTDVNLWDRGRLREMHIIALENGFVPGKY
ncbi:restriction endonuclease [Butyrivibrio sp. AE3004]|uniref:restriction endonuclease n=1 Tax=Butyrivibrio sp. AE3004 TaxID=1506994 RepID=UPI00068CFBA8|nr:restriction endonuclease [Butyrivibrio sp. AE3004]